MHSSHARVALFAAGLALAAGAVAAQVPPDPPAVNKECGEARLLTSPCRTAPPRCSSASASIFWRFRKFFQGGAGSGRNGNAPLLERILERTIKGLDVEIVYRGFSGEWAEAAGERLKIEVALNQPDIVLWQVGTNDALADVPVESFEQSVRSTVRGSRSTTSTSSWWDCITTSASPRTRTTRRSV